jgi:hypothetical protein
LISISGSNLLALRSFFANTRPHAFISPFSSHCSRRILVSQFNTHLADQWLAFVDLPGLRT